MSNNITFGRITSTLAVAAFRRFDPLRRLLEDKCFQIVGLQAAKNRFADFLSIHANGMLQSTTISINVLSKTSISFFVMGLSAHDSNMLFFFVVSGFAAAHEYKVDTLDVDVESCGSSPKFST